MHIGIKMEKQCNKLCEYQCLYNCLKGQNQHLQKFLHSSGLFSLQRLLRASSGLLRQKKVSKNVDFIQPLKKNTRKNSIRVHFFRIFAFCVRMQQIKSIFDAFQLSFRLLCISTDPSYAFAQQTVQGFFSYREVLFKKSDALKIDG